MMESHSEDRGISLLSEEDLRIYSVGISTAGRAELRMAQSGREVVATTLDRKGAAHTEALVVQEGLSERIEVRIEDVQGPLPYENSLFDFVYARLVFHYLTRSELQSALKELYRILRPGGKIFAVVQSTECYVAKEGDYNPQTGMTAYFSKYRGTTLRYFHTKESISNHLHEAGFIVVHTKSYKELLCHDYKREVICERPVHLIEVLATKA